MFVKSLLAAVLFFSADRPAVTVLCYHSFVGDKNMYSFSIPELKEQIEYFRMRGYNFISYSDFAAGRVTGKRNILVTIDDGHESVYKAYFEVLKPYGIKPLLGIYPAIIGKKDYALSWDKLKELVSSGCEIAGHGYNHLFVNQKLYNKDKKSFNREIYYSKKVLEETLGVKVSSYIYPFGDRSQVTIEHMKKAGYAHAFTIVNGLVELHVNQQAPYETKRYMLTRPTWKSTIAVIDRKVSGAKTVSVSTVEKTDPGPAAEKKITKPVAAAAAVKKKAATVSSSKKDVKKTAAKPVKKDNRKREGAAEVKPVSGKKGADVSDLVPSASDNIIVSEKKKTGISDATAIDSGGISSPALPPDQPADKATTAPVKVDVQDAVKAAAGIKKMKERFSMISADSRSKYSGVNDRFRQKTGKAGSDIKNLFDLNREKKPGSK